MLFHLGVQRCFVFRTPISAISGDTSFRKLFVVEVFEPWWAIFRMFAFSSSFEYFAIMAFSAISSMSPVNSMLFSLYVSLNTKELLFSMFCGILFVVSGQSVFRVMSCSIVSFLPASKVCTLILFSLAIFINCL